MTPIETLGFVIAAFLVGGFAGFTLGFFQGVKETEQRWSDAVKRKEHDDARH